MKKIFAILFTGVFALYLGGMQLIYWAKLDSARDRSFEYIKTAKPADKATRSFSFSEKEYAHLNWAEQDKEFTYDNVHYDILKINRAKGLVKIICYIDSSETEIANAFNNLLQKFFSPSQQSKKTENNILSKIYKEYLPVEYAAMPVKQQFIAASISQNAGYISRSAISDIWHPPATC